MGPFKCYVTQMGVAKFPKKALQRCKVQCYLRYEGVRGVQFREKKRYVTLERPLSQIDSGLLFKITSKI